MLATILSVSSAFSLGQIDCKGLPNNREWVQEGNFNRPHSAVADAQGNIYVVEWSTGGRVTKLERIAK